MIYPPSSGASSRNGGPGPNRTRGSRGKSQPVVQWKQRNVQEGLVVVDEQQLSRLIKRDPIEQYYELDPEPFATGLFANVRRCRSRDTGQHFAAKFSSRARYGDDCSAEIHHEIALLSLCAPSPRIVRLHDVFETDLEIIIVLEFAPGGDLQTIIDDNLVPFESDVVKFVRQLLEGLAYLHERKIAHLDIKPQNLVMMADFPDGDVKLCDFEISRVILEGSEIREILGTPDYVAPEILHYEPITLAADMWSLGVTTYVLLTGFTPFGGETDQETFCNISRAQLDFPEELFDGVSEDARDFIRRLLVRDPSARPSAKECLRHHWFSSHKPESGKQFSQAHTSSDPLKESSSVSHNIRNNQINLRKYLSKSREALFERVVQQQQNQKNSSLRKTTLLSQYHKTRLCESQMSLVSKSRERLLMGEHQLMMSPSFSRSREKLYGLRSLSRSHEVLDLCKGVGGVASATATPGILRSLTRATTADLSMLPFWRQQKHLACNRSSTTSIPSSLAIEDDACRISSVEDMDPLLQTKTSSSNELTKNIPSETGIKKDRTVSQKSTSSLSDSIHNTSHINGEEVDTLIPQYNNLLLNDDPDAPNKAEKKTEKIFSPIVSSTLLKLPSKEHCKSDLNQTNEHQTDDDKKNCKINEVPTLSMTLQTSNCEQISLNTGSVLTQTHGHGHVLHKQTNAGKSLCLTEEESTKSSTIKKENSNELRNKEEEFKMNISDSGSEDDDTEDKKDCDDDPEEEEPRYTVAQLVSAFNRHQEVVTRNSLEVTMTTTDRCTDRSHFPIGPNALRLFIPDIDISAIEKPQHRRKYRKQDSDKQTEIKDLHKEYETGDHTPTNCNSKDDNHTGLVSNPDLTTVTEKDNTDLQGSTNEETMKSTDEMVENVDSTNNNNVGNTTVSMCQLVIEAPNPNPHVIEENQDGEMTNKLHLTVNVEPQYMRSGSMSSDASLTPGTPSETAMSWEELASPSGTKQQQRRRSCGATVEPASGGYLGNNSSWGRVCTGSYTRAMEKFSNKPVGESERKSNRKSLTLLPTAQQNSNGKTRRKSSPLLKPFN